MSNPHSNLIVRKPDASISFVCPLAMRRPGLLFRHRSCRSGFSLVEITIAIGIVAYALVAIVGLFAVGLKSSRESVIETSLARIVHNVTYQYKGSHAPASGSPMTLRYNYEGEPEGGVPAASFIPYFMVNLTFEDDVSTKGITNVVSEFRQVKIEIASPEAAPADKRTKHVLYAATTLPAATPTPTP